ncbi:MAG: ABC transporter ATP-binding protein, partial [Prochlorococcaceae cyanobacterium]
MAFSLLPTPLRRNVRRLLEVFLDQRPASRLIRHTARQQWKLIAVNMTSSIGQALTEGATLGVIFMAVEWISENSKSAGGMVSKTSPLLNAIPGLEGLLHTLPSAATFIALMVLALALQIGQSLTLYLNSVSLEYFMARCRAVVTGRIHTQILSFSFPCASSYRIGNLSEFVSKGPEAVATQINIINQLLVGLLMIAMYLAILLKLSPWLMLAALGLSAVIGLVQKQLLPRIRLAANRVVDIEVSVNSRVIEDIQALRLLHSSGQLQMAINRLKGSLRDLELSLRRRGKLVQIIDPVSRVLPVAAFALIATLSLVVFDNRSAGVLPNLVTFMLALQRLNSRLSGISSCFNGLSANSGNINFLNKILEPRDKQFRRIGGTSFAGIKRNISFENVELRYTDNLAPALSRLNFSLPKGHTVALVGGSGAGKSSIADLLVGLYSPSEGRILIDGIDLETIDL